MAAALPWIKVYTDLPGHPKSLKLAKLLKDRRAWTYVVELWFWAADNAPDGDLSLMLDEEIGIRSGWFKEPARFAAALREVGFLDDTGRLHDWLREQAAHAERLRKDRERKGKIPDTSTEPSVESDREEPPFSMEVPAETPPELPLRAETRDLRSEKEDLSRARASQPAVQGPVQTERGSWPPGVLEAWDAYKAVERHAKDNPSFPEADKLIAAIKREGSPERLIESFKGHALDDFTMKGSPALRRLERLLAPEWVVAGIARLKDGPTRPQATKGTQAPRPTVPLSESHAPPVFKPPEEPPKTTPEERRAVLERARQARQT